jgi:hypothetical protein
VEDTAVDSRAEGTAVVDGVLCSEGERMTLPANATRERRRIVIVKGYMIEGFISMWCGILLLNYLKS